MTTLAQLYRWLPPEGVQILLVLFLSFLMGLEREEHKAAAADQYYFGGVRTYPLIGLIGYGLALVSGGQWLPVTVGFAVVGGFLMFSYWHKLGASGPAGITTEMSGLTTFLIGALVYSEKYWIATTLTVIGMFLLEFKSALEGLTKSIVPEEILTFTKFLLLTAVILPVFPNREFGPFQINPFKTWLVAVAVSTVSYGSYVIQKITKGRGGIILTAILGGVYSSTVTTVALAKRSANGNQPHLFSGGILIASGVMYVRLAILLELFNRDLLRALGLPFVVLAVAASGVGWVWSRLPGDSSGGIEEGIDAKNPLELRAAFLFAVLFLAMLVVTQLASSYLGRTGVFSLAAVMGVADVDPFVMGMTQSAGRSTALAAAAAAILIGTASNNLVKGIYAYSWSSRQTGIQSLALLAGLAILGLVPLLWVLK